MMRQMSKSAQHSSGGIQVIGRAGQILRSLAGERNGLSLSEVADRVQLPRSTVHRIITALESEGLVAAASPNGRYRLGPELVRMASTQHGELRAEIRPLLDKLSAKVDETVDLALLMRDQVSFIDQVPAPHRLRAVSAIGATFPAHCTANGKALLATMTDDALRKLLPARLKAYTENTITDRGKLLEELADVRRLGYGEDREEHTIGISAVGVAISDNFGPVAAISIPVPTQRFLGQEQALVDALLETRAKVSVQLGAL
jgi:DNA-binding IclR family transcriptional regulator